jgi:hypothetical protein
MKGSLIIPSLLLVLRPFAVCQTAPTPSDCSTLKYSRHKVSCLCGTVQVCSGDICGRPSDYNLDDDITVQLRDKSGTAILDSKNVVVEMRDRECTTQAGTKVSCNTTQRTFCFKDKPDGDYQLAFILFKNGAPQPAVKFPANYQARNRRGCRTFCKASAGPRCQR